MDNEQLIADIKEGFQQGKRREDLRTELMQKGWKEHDIDLAIYHIQREALKMIPGFSHFFAWYDDPKTRETLTTPKATTLILVGCAALLILLAMLFNFLFDPFQTHAVQRDRQREADLAVVRDAINHYYTQYHKYPAELIALKPQFIQTIPIDPSTQNSYDYRTYDYDANYQFCIQFETQNPQCIQATPIKLDPTTVNLKK